MDNRKDMQNLFEHIKLISEEAKHKLNEAVPYDPDILTSTTENLNKLLPGDHNFQVQSHIMGLTKVFLQEQAGQSTDSSADAMSLAPEVPQSNVLCTESDKKQQHLTTLDTKKKPVIMLFMHSCRDPSHMTSDCLTEWQPSSKKDVHSFHCAYHDSVGLLECQENEQAVSAVRSALLSCADSQAEIHQSSVTCTQWDTAPAMEHSTGQSGGLEQKLIAAKDAKRPHKSSKKAVKVHIDEKTSNFHDTFMKKLNLQIELCSAESSSVILAFRPFPCGTGTNKKAAMARVTGSSPSHAASLPGTSVVSSPAVHSQSMPSFKKMIYSSLVKVHMLVVGDTFNTHETFIQNLKLQINPCSAESSNVILVFCPVVSPIGTDMEAAMARVTVNKPVILVFMHHCHKPSYMTNITVQPSRSNIVQVVHCAYLETKGLLRCQENEQAVNAVRSALLRYVDLHDDVLQPEVSRHQPAMVQQQMAAQGTNNPNVTDDSKFPVEGTDPASTESESHHRISVPPMVHSTGSVKVHMLVAGETFNTHETFIQKLKLQIELCSAENSSIILVFCTVVSQIETDMEAAMDRVTGDKPVILVFMHHCHKPSYMTDITVQPSRGNIVQVVHCAFHEYKGLLRCQENEQAVKGVRSALLSSIDVQAEIPPTQSESEQQPIITNEVPRMDTKPMTGERESGQGTSVMTKTELHSISKQKLNDFLESVKSSISRLNPKPNKLNSSSLVKVHMLVAGQTFQAHETFIQNLNLQIVLCSAESSNVILVFCPVVSQIRTDMEAAMARVTEDKPVILVLMHHCHSPSLMTNITVQPCRSNIVQVVHCDFHETKGLLRCQENEQAVAEVQAMLKRYK